jgi:thiol-disulfide isomerase/thioredoxin
MKKLSLSILIMLCTLSVSFGQWTLQATNYTPMVGIKHISIVNADVVWTIGYDGNDGLKMADFSRTINGGSTWVSSEPSGYTTGYSASMIYAIDANTAWMPVASTDGGAILKTIDGGANWEAQTSASFSAPAGYPNVVHFWNADEGFCQGDPNGGYFELYITADGGDTWMRIPETSIPEPVAADEYGTAGFYSVIGDNIWFSTNKGRVYRSINKGVSWTVTQTPIADEAKIIFRDANNGILFNKGTNEICRTTDGGDTWTLFVPGGNFFNNGDLAFIPGTPSTFINTGGENGVSISTNDCVSFQTIESSVTGEEMYNTAWLDNSTGWVGSFTVDAETGGIYKYTGSALTSMYNNDLSLAAIVSPVSGVVATSNENVTISVSNLGGAEQSSFSLSYSINGNASVTETVTQNIPSGGLYEHTFSVEEDFSNAGNYSIVANVSLSGDQDFTNNSLTEDLTLYNWVPNKKVLCEEGTGTWCGWCPEGAVLLDFLKENYSESWIGIAVHNSDPMTVQDYDESMSQFLLGFPSGLIDRNGGAKSIQAFQPAFSEQMKQIPPASVEIENISWDLTTRLLSFDVVAKFCADYSGNLRLNAVIVENGVTGTASGFNQSNYFSGDESQMGGYENLPDPVPAADMVYNHVARSILSGWDGAESSVSTSLLEDQEVSYSYSYTIPADYNENHIEIVGMLINNADGTILNANDKSIEHIVGVNEINSLSEVQVYPNPTRGIIHIDKLENAKITICNLLGETIKKLDGVNGTTIIDLQNQLSGTYLLKIQQKDKLFTHKVILYN